MTNINPKRDSGWAWIIVMATFINFFLTLGLVRCLGLIQQEVAAHFDASTAHASLPGVISFVTYGLSTPVCVIVAEEYTIRKVIIGGLLGSIGIGLSSLLFNISWFIFFYGFGHGVSIACVYGNSFILLGNYFVRRRSLAMGLAFSGLSCGHLLMPVFIEFLFENYGLDGSILIISGVYLHVSVCGALLRPVEQYHSQENIGTVQERLVDQSPRDNVQPASEDSESNLYNSNQQKTENTQNFQETASNSPTVVNDVNFQDHLARTSQENGHSPKTLESNLDNSMTTKLKRMLDFSVLKNYTSLLFMLYSFFIFFAYFNMIIYINSFLEERGLIGYHKAFLLSLGGFGDLTSRMITGFFGDLRFVKKYMLKAVVSLLGGVNVLFLIVDKPIEFLSLQCFLYGFLGGSFSCLYPLVCFDFVQRNAVSKTIALALPTEGLAVGVGIILGYMKDVTGSYDITCVICGIFYLIGAALIFFLPAVARLEAKRPKTKATIEQ